MITVRDIQRTVARNFDVSDDEFLAPCRYPEIAQPRQIAMMLSRELTRHSLPRIGRFFNRDHTTILHGIRAAKARVSEDPELAAKVEQIRWIIRENYLRNDRDLQWLRNLAA